MIAPNQKTILIVEDDFILAKIGQKTLEQCGYKSIVANTGEDAIEIFKKSNTIIDLILMDIDLGSGIDGTEVAVKILKDHDVPVVFLSSHTEPEIVEKTEKITSYGYVVKGSGITVLDVSLKMAFKLFEANKTIVESEVKQKSMISNIADVIAIIDQNGINRYKSTNIQKWFGWLPEEVVGVSTWENIHPEHLERTQQFFGKLLQESNASGTAECLYKCKDGSYKWIEFTATNLTNDPIINGILLNYHDITERKQMEEAAYKSEAQKSAILNGITTNIAFVDNNLKIIWANKTAAQSVNKSPEEMIGKKCYTFWADPSKPCLNCPTKKAFQTKKTEQTIIHTPDGRIWEEKGEPVFDANGDLIGIVEIANDITERKLAEDALRESEESLAITLQSIGDGVIATNTDGLITRMNKTAERLTGWNFTEAKNKPLMDVFKIINAETRTIVENPVEKVLEKGEIVGLANHTVLISRDGTEYQIADSAAPIRDKEEKVRGVILVFSDVTEKYKAEEALRKNEESLRKSEATLRAIIDASPFPIALVDLNDDKIIYWSSQCPRPLWPYPTNRGRMVSDSLP